MIKESLVLGPLSLSVRLQLPGKLKVSVLLIEVGYVLFFLYAGCPPDALNPTIIQEPDDYTRTRRLYKNPITIQEPEYYTRARLLYKNKVTIQE